MSFDVRDRTSKPVEASKDSPNASELRIGRSADRNTHEMDGWANEVTPGRRKPSWSLSWIAVDGPGETARGAVTGLAPAIGQAISAPGRVDFQNGVYYEIKPNTIASRQEGAAQIAKYAEYMNENYPLSGGRKWAGRVVTYEQGDAIALFGR